MARNEATAMMRADNRKLSGDLSKSQKKFRSAFKKIGRGIKGALGKAFSPLGVGLGAIGIASIGKDVLDVEEKLTRLQIQSGSSAQEMGKFREQVTAMSKATGISRKELVGGVDALVNLTGKAGFSIDKLSVLAKANLATGASMKDLAGLSFALGKSFDLDTPDKLQKGLSGIIQAGKDGAIPLNEMAVILQQLSANFAQVGGKGSDAAADLASALQVLRPGFGSAAEAGTGLQGLLTALAKKSEILKKNNIKVFTTTKSGAKVFRGFRAILDDFANSELIRDPAKLTKALGRVEAKKALDQLIKNRKGFEDLAGAARKSNAVITDSQKFQESNAFKLKKAMNDIKLAIAKVFTPKRIEAFASVMAKVGKLVEFMVDNIVAMGAAFAAIKLGQFAFQMQAAARSAQTAAAASAATNTSMAGSAVNAGKFAKFIGGASAAFAAFAGGFAIGKFLDKNLGKLFGSKKEVSTVIAENVDSALSTAGTEKVDQAFLRGRLSKINEAANKLAFTGKAGATVEDVLRTARASVIAGKQTGSIFSAKPGADVSDIDPSAVSVESISKKTVSLLGGRQDTFGPDATATKDLQNAVKLLKDAAALQKKGVKITLGVDPETGSLKIVGAKGATDRRQTQ